MPSSREFFCVLNKTRVWRINVSTESSGDVIVKACDGRVSWQCIYPRELTAEMFDLQNLKSLDSFARDQASDLAALSTNPEIEARKSVLFEKGDWAGIDLLDEIEKRRSVDAPIDEDQGEGSIKVVFGSGENDPPVKEYWILLGANGDIAIYEFAAAVSTADGGGKDIWDQTSSVGRLNRIKGEFRGDSRVESYFRALWHLQKSNPKGDILRIRQLPTSQEPGRPAASAN